MEFTITATTAGRSVHTYRVTFMGDRADETAAQWIERKRTTHAGFAEAAQDDPAVAPVPEAAVKTLAALYPECEHGLSAHLCMGPDHYPSIEWEMDREHFSDDMSERYADERDDDVDYDSVANAYERGMGW